MMPAEDKTILELAKKEGRIILTMDLDFGYLSWSYYISSNTLLINLLKSTSESELHNSIIIVEENRVRIRKLPIEPKIY